MEYYEDFIRVYDNAVSKQFCRGLIEYFEWCKQNNKTWDRSAEALSLTKKDNSCLINPLTYWDIDFAHNHLGGYLEEFNAAFWDNIYPSYINEFTSISSFGRHTIHSYKIQKTLPSEGYHVWHCEQDCRDNTTRFATYILFLNDVVSGGETEFLHQRKRVSPKEGSLVIFPASYTHVHRGNPPLSGEKYILTGWIEFS